MNKLMQLKNKHPKRIMKISEQSRFLKSFGIWMDGKCSWLSSREWDLSPTLDQTTSLSILVAYHKKWRIQITFMQENSPTSNESVVTIILKNQTDSKRNIKFVFHSQRMGEREDYFSFVSPSKRSIVQCSESQLTLIASQFYRETESQLAVGKKEIIWLEKEGKLALAPLCSGGHESMIVTKMELNPWQEIYGRIWEVSGHSEEEIYVKHHQQIMYEQLKQATERTI